jgi:NAD kinase
MKHVLIVYQEGQLQKVLPKIKIILHKRNITFSKIEREKLSSKCYTCELVIVVGGDGTFLRASHYNKNKPMFGINPAPKYKEGFFMQTNLDNFEKPLKKILDEKFETIDILRLKASIDNKKVTELALNDFYIGAIKAYSVFNYNLKFGNKTEFQRGSGIVIGTPAGSTAWTKSAGGEILKITDKKFQFVARELYEANLTKNYKLRKGVLSKDQILEIQCKCPGILIVDCVGHEYETFVGSIVKISVSNYPLKYIKI